MEKRNLGMDMENKFNIERQNLKQQIEENKKIDRRNESAE